MKLLILALCACLCAVASGEWKNSLKPKGEPSARLPLAGRTIVMTAREGPQKKAAEDLQHWLKEITGVELPIVFQGPAKSAIVLQTDPTLGDDGYSIAVNGDALMLSGGTKRGILNAVYALLEEDLGCRFYTDESIKLPKTDAIEVIARRYTPQLRVRDPFYKFAFDPVWSLRNRTNAPDAKVPEDQGGHIDYGGFFVHTYATLVPPDKYFKDHPEYFMLRDGQRIPNQLCTTNDEVVKVVTESVLAALKKSPGTEIISVSKNDSGGDQLCQCDKCKQLRDAEGAEMAVQLYLVNRVAASVAKDYPGVAIDTLAYLDTIGVPKTVRPANNVIIRLCNDTVGAWGKPFTPAEQCRVSQIARSWAAVHNRISIWDYTVNFSHYLAPMPNLDVIASNIRFWAANKAEGVMLQGGYQGTTEQDELKCWVASKLLWDPARDENALAADFIEGHYGPAAPAIFEYQELLKKMRKDFAQVMDAPPGGIRYPMDAPFFTKEFLASATATFANAHRLANGNDRVRARIDRAELPVLYVRVRQGERGQVVADFERIARENKVQFLEEGAANFEPFVAQLKAR